MIKNAFLLAVYFLLLSTIQSMYRSPISKTRGGSSAGIAQKKSRGQVIAFWYKDKIVLNEDGFDAEDDLYASIPPNQLVAEIKLKMLEMKSTNMAEDGSSVNYEGIKESGIFKNYLCLVRQLKRVDLAELTSAERKSFLLNIYNCLIVHAIVAGLLSPKAAGSTLERMKLYASASYNIGGTVFSLNDIENGLLRGNKKSAVPLTSLPFPSENDQRKNIMLTCDPRIHFALNCAAVSCPPIAVYSSDAKRLDEELSIATEGFLDQAVSFEPKSKLVKLSMLFSWYKDDFGSTDEEIFDWIKRNGSVQLREKFNALESEISSADGSKVSVKYDKYNWDLNQK